MAATSTGRFGLLRRAIRATRSSFSNHYFKVYLLLLVLLAVSIIGPTIGILFVTLVTAFGIAVIKAWLVIKHFMHLSIERPIAKLFLAASVLLMALFWGGVSPDVQAHEGRMWVNLDAKAAVARGIAEPEVHAEEAEHAEETVHASLVPTEKSNNNVLPGGYNFTHAAFWSVLALVAVGTNAVAIILSLGAMILVFETLSHIPIVQRLMGPVVGRILRLPGMGRIRELVLGKQEG